MTTPSSGTPKPKPVSSHRATADRKCFRAAIGWGAAVAIVVTAFGLFVARQRPPADRGKAVATAGTVLSSTDKLPTRADPPASADTRPAGTLAVDLDQLPEPVRDALNTLAESVDPTEVLALAAAKDTAAFAPLLLLHAGMELYTAGCYSESLLVLSRAWDLARAATPQHWTEHKLIARIGARLGELHARLGHARDLRSLLSEMKNRPIEGAETLAFTNLRQAAEGMEQFPEHSFKCGPLALGTVFAALQPDAPAPRRLAEIPSPPTGFSLAEVARLGEEIGFPVTAVRPSENSIPVPSVVHWRSNHYAAITRFHEGRYLVEDPTFQRNVWMAPETLQRESSGFFLVPADRVDPAWSLASAEQAASTFGKGAPSQTDANDQGGEDAVGDCRGLPVAGFNNFYAALTLRDIPLFYSPPVGPPVELELTYFDASNYDHTTAPHGHPGKKWILSWMRHIELPDLTTAGAGFRVVRANGKTETFQGVVSGGSLNVAKAGLYSRSRLSVTGGAAGTPITRITKNLPDGSTETYGYLAAGANPRAFGAITGNGTRNSKFYLAAATDPQGNALRFRYAAGSAKLKGVVDALGQETTIHYSDSADGLGADAPARRLISAVKDPFGRVVRFRYDTQERLVSLTDVAGIATTFAYEAADAPDFITSMTTPYGKSTFAKSGTSLLLTDPMGLQEKVSFAFNRSDTPLAGVTGKVATAAETPATAGLEVANGQTYFGFLHYGVTLHWDKKTMRLFGDQPDKAYQTRWAQQTQLHTILSGVPSSRRPALSHREWYHYPGQPNPGTIGTTAQPSLRIRRITDQNGQPADEIHRYEYNSLGHPTRAIDPLGRETEWRYAPNGIDLTAIVQKRGTSSVTLTTLSGYGHNAPHRPRYLTDAAGQTTELRWNTRGQLIESINPLGHRTVHRYDAKGYLELIEGTDPAQPTKLTTLGTFQYDTAGRLKRVTTPDGSFVGQEYDALNRGTKTTYPDGTSEIVTYRNLSAITEEDRLRRVTTHTYNANQQRISSTDPAGRTLKYEWCACGALQVLLDAMNRPTRWHYDHGGRAVAKEYADGSRDTYHYDPASGRLASVSDTRGTVKSFAYHLDGRLAALRYPGHPKTPPVSFTYHPHTGQPATMTDGIGTTTYTYHPIAAATLGAGQLASVDGPWTNDTITYAYDRLGRLTGRTLGAVAESMAFDPAGRLQSTNSQLGTYTITYDGVTSRPRSLRHQGGQKTEFSYWPAIKDFNLSQITHLKPDGSTPLSIFNYDHDAAGRLLTWRQQTDQAAATARTWSFTYDHADQLVAAKATQGATTVATQLWTYDPAGNRRTQSLNGTTTTTSYNALNELVSSSATLPATSFEWDAENRLLAVTRGPDRTEFTYDGLGRRVRVTEKKNGTTTAAHTYLWDGLTLREQRDASGATPRQRYFGGGYTDLTGPTPKAYLQTTDHLGSIRETTDTAGTLRQRISYDLWGTPTFATPNRTSPFAFTGHFWHAGSNLHLAPYRAYASDLGRWISRDPIAEAGGVNLFGYVGNSPAVFLDKLGLERYASVEIPGVPNTFGFVGHFGMVAIAPQLSVSLQTSPLDVIIGAQLFVGLGPGLGGSLTFPGITLSDSPSRSEFSLTPTTLIHATPAIGGVLSVAYLDPNQIPRCETSEPSNRQIQPALGVGAGAAAGYTASASVTLSDIIDLLINSTHPYSGAFLH